ncbi:ADP-heptose--LPS heptosyltransferase RfaF [Tenacibaculum sp. SZ-18]|nr:ADP-heptose--LPS heptosyltransferase RfaF [Tenacibaculum sp. SZ-18]
MGDVAMTVPIIRLFVSQYPDVKITFVSRAFLKPLFDEIPNVSFFPVDTKSKHKGFSGLYQLFKELNSLNTTHFADAHNVLRSKVIRLFFSLFSKVKTAKIDKGRKEKKALTRHNNKIFKQLKTSHQRYADVFNKLGFEINIENYTPPKNEPLSLNNTELIGNKNKHWIGIAPFAAFESKTYPEKLMLKVIEELSQNDLHIFLFGGKADIRKLRPLEKQFSNVTSIAGKLSNLKHELNLIGKLDVMISMDSGNAHFAAMLGIDTVTIWGNTHPYAGFAPFNQPTENCILPDLEKYPALPCSIYGNKTLPGYENVMESIPPEKIINKIKEILSKK